MSGLRRFFAALIVFMLPGCASPTEAAAKSITHPLNQPLTSAAAAVRAAAVAQTGGS